MVNGKKIGLSLGSGGARGLAHIGVLQVLEENGMKPDMVSGCSAGAVFGGIYAAGTNLYLLERFAGTLAAKDLVDPSIPTRGGFISGEKVEELVRILTHDLCFEQAKLPFWCTATDMGTGAQKVFSTGKMHLAIRASLAVPGVFSPVRIDGNWYADGGVLEELPVAVLRDNGADVVITSDLSIKKNNFNPEHPSALSTLQRSFSIMQQHMTDAQTDKGDLIIRPDASFMGLLLPTNASQSVDAGRKTAQEALPALRRLLGMDQ